MIEQINNDICIIIISLSLFSGFNPEAIIAHTGLFNNVTRGIFRGKECFYEGTCSKYLDLFTKCDLPLI